jgi:DNA-binding NtrC family response regulator
VPDVASGRVPDRVLVLEDEDTLRQNIVRYLGQHGCEAVACATVAEGQSAIAGADEIAVALLDVNLPDGDGLSLARALAERHPDAGVVIMTAYGSVDTAIEALHAGAHDFLVKPVRLKDLANKIERLREHRRLLRENVWLRRRLAEAESDGTTPISRSRVMADLLGYVRQVANSNATVLIHGESGAGKEVVARYLHAVSPRRDGPFVAFNVAAIPDNLIESHLFGHEKGAFTGAERAREGLLRTAAGGTVLLDEIGELPPALQAKLLRALDAKEIYPLGSDQPVRVDVRILAATNADLGELERQKKFRSDLYFRLAGIRIEVPPLRQRQADIPALAQHFLGRHNREHGRAVIGIDGPALGRLVAYAWPGNVRELSHVIERAVIVCPGNTVGLTDLPPEVAGRTATSGSGYHDAMAEFESALIRATLERTQGDRREAARLLGLSLATLYRRLERLDLRDVVPAPAAGGRPPEPGP